MKWAAREGYLFIARKARKEFACCVCRQAITRGTQYQVAERAGSGVQGRVYPDRIHEQCQDGYLEKVAIPGKEELDAGN